MVSFRGQGRRGAWAQTKKKTYLSQLLHRILAYPILFEHDLRSVDDIVHRFLEHAALQWMSSFSDSPFIKGRESMSLARAD